MSERMDKLQRLGQECEQATRLQEREAIVAWLREKERSRFIDCDPVVYPAHFDEYGAYWPERVQKMQRLPDSKDFANAIEAGEHLKENDDAET